MLFSIVTVCLNPGKDLDAAVCSSLEQDHADFEVVIKDGGSRDGTQHRTWADSRVRFVSAPDRGIYEAMNEAAELCHGKYLVFLNAGDSFCGPRVLSALAPVCAGANAPALVYCDVFNKRFGVTQRYPDKLRPGFLYRRPLCHQVTFVRRDWFRRAEGFDTTFSVSADYDLLVKLAVRHRVPHVHVPIVGVSYKDSGFSAAKSVGRTKRKEVSRIRRTYYSFVQRLRYGALSAVTLPRVRAWLLTEGPPILRNAYVALAGLVAPGVVEGSNGRPGVEGSEALVPAVSPARSDEDKVAVAASGSEMRKVIFVFGNRPTSLVVSMARLLSTWYVVRTVYLSRPGSPVEIPKSADVRDDESSVIVSPAGRGLASGLANRLGALRRVARRIRLERPDVIHAWHPDMLLAALVAARRLPDAKVVFSLQDTTGWMRSRAGVMLQRLLYRRVDMFFVTSSRFESAFLRGLRLIPAARSVVYVPNVPAAEVFEGFAARAVGKGLTVGYLGFFRGPATIRALVRGVEIARREGAEHRVLFAGVGVEQDLVERLTREHQFVEFAGSYRREEIRELYGRTDVVYAVYDQSPDKEMALAFRLCEAINCRLPIIVPKGTHMAEVVEKHGVGVAVDAGDAEELARVLDKLYRESGLRQMIARQCEVVRREFTFEWYEDRIREAYASLLENPERVGVPHENR